MPPAGYPAFLQYLQSGRVSNFLPVVRGPVVSVVVVWSGVDVLTNFLPVVRGSVVSVVVVWSGVDVLTDSLPAR